MIGPFRFLPVACLTVVCMTAFAQTGSVPTSRADFKGGRLGMTMEEWKRVGDVALANKYSCKPLDEALRMLGDVGCHAVRSETVAGILAEISSFYFFGEELTSINVVFSSDEFDTVADALEERFGKPASREREVLQTRAGVSYENDVRTWYVGPDRVEARKYGSKITLGELLYTSKKGVTESKSRMKQRAKEGKKDL